MELILNCKKITEEEYLIEIENNKTLTVYSPDKLKPGDIIIFVNTNFCIKNKLRTYEGFYNHLKSIKSFGNKSIEKIIEFYKNLNIEPHKIRYYFEKDFEKKENHKLLNKRQIENYEKYLKERKESKLSEEEFIKENNITPSLVKKLKANKIDILKQFFTNPYEVAFSIKGIGFKTIDKIALKIKDKYDIFNEEEFRKMRLSAAIYYTLLEAEKEGHVYLAKNGMEYFLKKKLGIKETLVDKELEEILKYLEKKSEIIVTNYKLNDEIKIVYLKKNYELEENIVNLIKERLENSKIKNNQKQELERNIKNNGIKVPEGFKLSEKQEESIYSALSENILIITGGPGTGKTTVAKYIYENLKYYYPYKKVQIMAPTGTAAKRIGGVIGTKATTIHVGIGWKYGYFVHNKKNKLKADIVIIDESSMIDLPLFNALLNALDSKTKLILIGDKDQLPPVGIGKPFEDLLLSNVIPCVKLDKVYRQSDDNPIASFSEAVNKCETKGEWRYKYVFREYKPYKKLNIIIKRQYNKKENPDYMDNLKNDLIDLFFDIYNEKNLNILDIQILGIKNKGRGGIEYINKKIQEGLFPQKSYIKNTKFKIGDKVIQTFNNYNLNVMNGEIGIIESVNNNKVIVKFLEGNSEYKYIEYELDRKNYKNSIKKNLELAYSMTIHKSQGQEFNTVLILLNDYWMLNRKLIYTAVTRSKENAIILTNYLNLFKGIETSYGLTEIEINGKKKLVQIKRNTLLDYKLKLVVENHCLKI